jgi:hypothetical protein
MSSPSRLRSLIVCLAALPALATLAACGDDGGGTSIDWPAPPSTATVGQPINTTWSVTTDGTIHVSILRACFGDVPDCGVENGPSDIESFGEEGDPGQFTGSITLDQPGTWSLMIYTHIDLDPHVTEPVLITCSE